MREGYERRPEYRDALKIVLHALFGVLALWFVTIAICASVIGSSFNENSKLTKENAQLRAQLAYYTCERQLEPIPQPVEVGDGPTLIEEPRPLTEEEFDELQKKLKESSHEN